MNYLIFILEFIFANVVGVGTMNLLVSNLSGKKLIFAHEGFYSQFGVSLLVF